MRGSTGILPVEKSRFTGPSVLSEVEGMALQHMGKMPMPRQRDFSQTLLGSMATTVSDYAKVKPGTDRCPFCHRSLKVTGEVAAFSNKLQEDSIVRKWKAV